MNWYKNAQAINPYVVRILALMEESDIPPRESEIMSRLQISGVMDMTAMQQLQQAVQQVESQKQQEVAFLSESEKIILDTVKSVYQGPPQQELESQINQELGYEL